MKRIIAVASGKGGVGKSTVATNLAVALANPEEGAPKRKIALVDIDFYGPSIPTLMGGGEIRVDHENRFIPAFKYNVHFISISFFLKNPDDPVVWRGPMFGKAITQLFQDTSWGEPDICIVDMPPGTGDAQLSLSQLVSLEGVVMVTTPQEVALADVRRAINMFRKVNVNVVGVVENMAGFTAPDGTVIDLFGAGGGAALAEAYKVPLLGSIPIDLKIREGGDRGTPAAIERESASGKLYHNLAQRLISELDKSSGAAKLKVVN